MDKETIVNEIQERIIENIVERYYSPEYFSRDDLRDITMESIYDANIETLIKLLEYPFWEVSKDAVLERLSDLLEDMDEKEREKYTKMVPNEYKEELLQLI